MARKRSVARRPERAARQKERTGWDDIVLPLFLVASTVFLYDVMRSPLDKERDEDIVLEKASHASQVVQGGMQGMINDPAGVPRAILVGAKRWSRLGSIFS